MRPRPKLTEVEAEFLRAWVWEEANPHFPRKAGAKRTQIERSPYSAPLLADIVSAAMTAEEQVAIAAGPAPERNPPWPWPTDHDLQDRHRAAKEWLESRFAETDLPRA